MRIRVLGCHGAEMVNCGTCGFLINETVLLDAGTVCSSLTLAEQVKIRHVLISHIHMDHIKGLPFLSETLVGEKERKPVVISSLPQVLSGLKRHLFNGRLWPDFTTIPDCRHPVFRLRAMQEGRAVRVGDLSVRAFSVNHQVPCAGFLIREGDSSLLYSGDTSQTDRIWKAAARDKSLKAAMIETSFPDALKGLAASSKHLTPALLSEEFLKIGKPDLPLYVYHMKPRYLGEIRRELGELKIAEMIILKDGVTFGV